MEATSKKSSLLLSKYFQIIHLCLSIAVVIAMVHNQLVNDGRFKKLEQEVYRQENFNTVQDVFPKKKNLESPHKVIKRNVPMGINKDIKNESTSDSRKEKVLDNSERDVLACLDVLRTFANRSRTNVELNICKPFRGLPGQRGIRGTRGKRGKQGRRGLQGLKGSIGKEGGTGKHGPPGPRGEKGFSGNVTVIGLKGDTGPKGDNGDKGGHGARGPPGNKGSKGEAGGQKGDPGDRGEKGSIGQRGCPGDSFAAPRFYASPKHLIFTERETATLFCNATANPYSHITWYRDSVTLVKNGRYVVEQNVIVPSASFSERTQCDLKSHSVTQSSLVIKQSRQNDSGSYFCEARNVMGVSRYEIRLLIHVYVQFTITPTSITVIKKENIRLRCRASGVPSPVITWQRKDNGAMPNRYRVTMGDLLITGITKQEEGVYKCVASNVLGSRTTEATITVNVFPEIVSFKKNISTINESQTLALPCTATGFPQPAIDWYKKNGSLPDGRYTYNSQRLSISKMTYADRGEYVCTANNTLGAVSKTARVIVQVAPKLLVKPKSTEYGYRRHDTILNFTVFANPPATIKWMRYGKVLQTLSQSYSSLRLTNVQYKDSGLYKAVARNILGEVRVTTLLIVRDPAAGITSFMNDHKYHFNCSEYYFIKVCSALGNPTPTIVWKYSGVTLISTTGTSLTLNITNVNTTHAGRYTCEASNRFGSARQHFDLEIEKCLKVHLTGPCSYSRNDSYSGRFTSPGYPGNYDNKQKCSLTLQLTFNATISLLFEIFSTERCCDKVRVYDGESTSSPSLGVFSGTSIPSRITSTSNQLFITFTTDGSATRSGFSAKYQIPPTITSIMNEKKYTFNCSDSYDFSKVCSASGYPTPAIVTIVWKHNNETLMSKNRTSLTLNITNVNMTHAGRYTCEASNRYGTARQSFDLEVQKCFKVQLVGPCNYSRFDSNSGRFTSPGYPGNYENNQKCSLTLQLTFNANISLLFEKFTTEKNYDKVKVYDDASSSSFLGEFSGNMNQFNITSTSNQLYITFTTDGSNVRTGFVAKYKVSIGSDSEIPAESCQQIKAVVSSAVSGIYWVKHALNGNIEQIYCDMNSTGTECSSYTMLTDATRKSTSVTTSAVCDNNIVKKWYRFSNAIGNMMASTCVPSNRCNTHASGWLSDPHPTVEQGLLSRKVCFHWSSNCCESHRNIRVRNCGKFYIYELAPPPGCQRRYCSAG